MDGLVPNIALSFCITFLSHSKLIFKMRITLYLLCWLLLFSSPVFGQKKELKTKFGKISPEEMAMISYPADPAAPAVVLFDKGRVSHRYTDNRGFVLEFERHVRIKIFSKDAYPMADVAFFHFKSQKVADLKAVSYNIENGKVVETELEKANVFDEKITRNRLLLKFNVPAVREGSIIEYKYKLIDEQSVGIGVQDWTFQRFQVPTQWSEFEAEVPAFISFKKMSQGETPYLLADEENEDKQISINFTERSDENNVTSTAMHQAKLTYSFKRMHFIQENVPALKPEPYMTSPSDGLSRISFDIQAVYNTNLVPVGDAWKVVNGGYKEYNNTWTMLGKELFEDAYEDALNSSRHTSDAVTACVAGKTDPSEKVVAIYEYIGKNYQIKDLDYLWMTQSLETLVKDRKGSPTDLNVLLVNMLRRTGLNAWPVLLSTRSHGLIHPFRVSPDEMNRVIAAVEIDGKTPLLLDMAAFPNPVGLLDAEDLNDQGLLLKSKEDVVWVPLQNSIQTRTAVLTNLAIQLEGGLSGAIAHTESGYGVVAHRKSLKEKDAESLVRMMYKEWAPEATFSNLKIENADNWRETNLKINFNLESTAFVTVSGNKLYLTPTLGLGIRENPFKNPERRFHIDLGSPHDDIYIFEFKIPAGYQVEEMPKPIKVMFGENALIFEYLVESNPERIKIMVRNKVKKAFITADQYPDLRQFFTTMIAKMEEQVVLSKS